MTQKYDVWFWTFFLTEFLKTVTLSCIFSEFLGMFVHNLGSLIKILYLELFNLNDGILKLDVEKLIWCLRVSLRNLFLNIFSAVWDLIFCFKTRLFKILSWNIFKILLSRDSSLACANLSLQCMIRMAFFCRLLVFLRFVLITSAGYISKINVGMYEGVK